MKFAQRFNELREDAEPPLNQTEFGALFHMNQAKVSRIERGESEPSLQDIFNICKQFNISADYLLGLIDEPLPCRRTK